MTFVVYRLTKFLGTGGLYTSHIQSSYEIFTDREKADAHRAKLLKMKEEGKTYRKREVLNVSEVNVLGKPPPE